MTKVNTITCIANPNNVGHPWASAILPSKLDKREFTNLYAHGLKRINNTAVVYNVKRHLSKYVGDMISI